MKVSEARTASVASVRVPRMTFKESLQAIVDSIPDDYNPDPGNRKYCLEYPGVSAVELEDIPVMLYPHKLVKVTLNLTLVNE